MTNPVRQFAGSIYRRSRSRLGYLLDNSIVALRNLVDRRDISGRLLILDDIFPQMLSAFRIAEYNFYLQAFRDAQVYSTATAFPLVGENRPFEEVVREYVSYFPEYRGRVHKYTSRGDYRSALIYTVFLNNAYRFVDVAERVRTPFAFTLYPGGGFAFGDDESNHKLRRVLSSPRFRKVIVTQKISHEYLINESLCAPEQIEFVYGGVFPLQYFAQKSNNKLRFPGEKDTVDICFVANKYMPRGLDKGYDVFIEAAHMLSRLCNHARFHVVGPFDHNDIDVSEIEDKIHFYGTIYTNFLIDFYAKMDIILSPNKPFVLRPGAFDGFPTGACVEAGLSGVAVFCSDPLQQNIMFQDSKEIVIISANAEEVCHRMLYFCERPEELYALAARGQEAFVRVFGITTQMQPRLNLLSFLMNGK
jgi:glycosyltransferase involved in cell wall biosynthesis